MDWAYGAPEDSCAKAGVPALGFYVGDRYKVCNGAIDALHDIITKLDDEDKAHRTYRRLLGFSQVVRRDLIPLMVEYDGPEAIELFDAAIKLLADLTTPLECLFANLRSIQGGLTSSTVPNQTHGLTQEFSSVSDLVLLEQDLEFLSQEVVSLVHRLRLQESHHKI